MALSELVTSELLDKVYICTSQRVECLETAVFLSKTHRRQIFILWICHRTFEWKGAKSRLLVIIALKIG